MQYYTSKEFEQLSDEIIGSHQIFFHQNDLSSMTCRCKFYLLYINRDFFKYHHNNVSSRMYLHILIINDAMKNISLDIYTN